MNPPKMPIHIGDFLRDTGHLRAMLIGAYMLLLFHHWSTGSLPDDDEQLSAIARLSSTEWRKARPILIKFFGEGWYHDRVEKDLAAAKASYEKRARAGEKGGKAKAENKQRPSIAKAGPEQPLTFDQGTKEESSSLRSEGALDRPKRERAKPRAALPDLWVPDERDIEHATQAGFSHEKIQRMASAFADHHRAKATLSADWNASWRTWCSNEIKFNGERNAHGFSNNRANHAAGSAPTRDTAVLAGMGRALERRRAARAADDPGRQDVREAGGASVGAEPDANGGTAADDGQPPRQLTILAAGHPGDGRHC
jgi:uncharacterized protein YdaU (DUF1376 family)